ncbi:uncharacterized protein [Diadema antillarum]|uniref:uncharacterized protein n=1 Tax=Diadema antillarum TaxID=105358 RepID=UPI003A8698D7
MSAMMSHAPHGMQGHVKPQRPLLVPDRYNGKAAWMDYQHHFEACKEVNGWNDFEAASFLMASLQGEALRCVSGVNSRVRCSYHELLRILGRRFGTDIRIGTTIQSVKVLFADIKCEGILGMDFLLPSQGILDFNRRILQIYGEEIQCTTQRGETFVARVKVASTTTIPAGHEAIVPGRIIDKGLSMAGTAVIEPLENGGEVASKGVIIGRTLVDAGKDVIPVRVFNPGDSTCEVQEGLTVGMITSADVQTQGCDSDELPPHVQDLYERSIENLDPQYHQQVKMCLVENADVFSKNSQDIGRTDIVQHSIKTWDAKPVKRETKEVPAVQPVGNRKTSARPVRPWRD